MIDFSERFPKKYSERFIVLNLLSGQVVQFANRFYMRFIFWAQY